MSIFGDIVNAIFTKAKAAGSAVASAATAATTAVTGGTPAKRAPMTRDQVEEMLQKIADDSGRSEYNWDTSIVDLMKLLDLDSSLKARSELAKELGYTGALNGSAEMNIWLHKQVMQRLEEGKDIGAAA